MLTIGEYVTKMKKADKLDEFDFSKQSENMAAVMRYVMNYFTEYLTMETCDAAAIKQKQSIDKMQDELERKYPESKNFIIDFYLKHRIRIDREIEKWMKDVKYLSLFCLDEEFSSMAEQFCSGYKIQGDHVSLPQDAVKQLMVEIKFYSTEDIEWAEIDGHDRHLIDWVNETYRSYGVNLYAYAYDLVQSYRSRYVSLERVDLGNRLVYLNNYNHRYNDNPFGIDQIYEDNKHRPFLADRRGEFEMLAMYIWVFEVVNDDDYWPEYVNLCVSCGRVSIVERMNALIPVTVSGLKYPEDVPCAIEHIVTTDCAMKKVPGDQYVLRVDTGTVYTNVWQSMEQVRELAEALKPVFCQYGVPRLLEVTAPAKTAGFDEEAFLSCCASLEKKMKKYSPMKVAIVNGSSNKKTKPPSYLSTIEDILKLKGLMRTNKIHLRFSIDFSVLFANRRSSRCSDRDCIIALAEMKNSIVCISLPKVSTTADRGVRYRRRDNDSSTEYLDRFRYPHYDDIYAWLSTAFNDNQQRFFIPTGVIREEQLEALADNLLRAGFSFCKGGDQNG